MDEIENLSNAYDSVGFENKCINGECSHCGNCCSNFLPLSTAEIAKLRTLVKKRGLKPETRLLLNNYYEKCPFLNGKNECVIYDSRPDICRFFQCDTSPNQSAEEYKRMLMTPRIPVDLREEIF